MGQEKSKIDTKNLAPPKPPVPINELRDAHIKKPKTLNTSKFDQTNYFSANEKLTSQKFDKVSSILHSCNLISRE